VSPHKLTPISDLRAINFDFALVTSKARVHLDRVWYVLDGILLWEFDLKCVRFARCPLKLERILPRFPLQRKTLLPKHTWTHQHQRPAQLPIRWLFEGKRNHQLLLNLVQLLDLRFFQREPFQRATKPPFDALRTLFL